MDTQRQKAIIDIRVREVPLQLSGPVPENVLLGTELLGGSAGPEAAGDGQARRREGAPAGPRPPLPTVPPAGDESEFTTTPQAAPERVAPPARVPGEKKPDEKKPEIPRRRSSPGLVTRTRPSSAASTPS